MNLLAGALLVGALAAASCDQVVRVGGGFELLIDVPASPVRDLDVLFVIDDSGSMADEQDQLAASMAGFAAALASDDRGPLDLQVAVTSTDLGAGPVDLLRCEGEGDGGHLLVGPAGADCQVDGTYLVDVAVDGGDARVTNYPAGRLAETLACMTRLGASGCGFEQPLAAARRALDGSHPDSAGFVRDGALLAVFFVTDEDDCSASDRSLFDPGQDDRAAPLGELSSFRCFEFGVSCDGTAPDPVAARSVGPRRGCRPADDSAYLAPVADFADFLRDLKRSPALVLVGGIFGDAGPVAVEEVDGRLALADVCPSPTASAAPAVRLHALAAGLSGPDGIASLCDPDPSARPAALAASALAALRATRCLRRDPLDADPDRAGVQPACRAFTIADRARREIAPCAAAAEAASGAATPCFAIEPDLEACRFGDSALALRVDGPLPAAPDVRLQLECLAGPPSTSPPDPVD